MRFQILVVIALALLLLVAAVAHQEPSAFTSIALRITSNTCAIDSLSIEWWLGSNQSWSAKASLPTTPCILFIELPTVFEVPPQARVMTIGYKELRRVEGVAQ